MKRNVKSTMTNVKSITTNVKFPMVNTKSPMVNVNTTILSANTGVMSPNNVSIIEGKNTGVAPTGVKEKILRIASPIARKEHVCSVCGKKILIGERYQSITLVRGKKIYVSKRHLSCHDTVKVNSEQDFQREVIINTKQLYNSFTFQEQMEIAFFPLVITEIAWRYAYKVLDEAAAHKINETVKLSRAVRELRKKYLDDLKIDLDSRHLSTLNRAVDEFLDNNAIEFTKLYFSVNNEVKRIDAEIKYKELRTYAYISLAMIDALRRHNKSMNDVIAERLSTNTRMRSILVPARTSVLGDCMEAFLSPLRYVNILHVDTAIKIILNKIRMSEFVIK